MKFLLTVDFASNRLDEYLDFMMEYFTEGDMVYILTVVQEVQSILEGNEIYVNYNKEMELDARNNLANVGHRLTDKKVKHACVLAKGEVNDSILYHANEFEVDMVILSRRRNLGIVTKLLSSSTSNYIALNCKKSIFVF